MNIKCLSVANSPSLISILVTLAASFIVTADTRASTIDLSSLPLAPNSYWNGSNNAGGFSVSNLFFNNSFTYYASLGWESWSGWSYSNITNNTTGDYTNQYSAITGGGVTGAGSNYALAYGSGPNDSYINFPANYRLNGINITNSTYAYYSMLNGDSFSKQFGPTDWFKLTITGYSSTGATGSTTGSVDFYLAQNSSIVNAWSFVSLASLSNQTQSIGFELTSSDNGPYGMNTPAYFALGSLDVTTVPEPGSMILLSLAIIFATVLKRRCSEKDFAL